MYSLQLAIGHGAKGAARLIVYHPTIGGFTMKLSAPQQITWWIALIVGVVGIIAHLVAIPVLSGLAFWLVAVAFVLLILATFLKGL